MVRTSFPATCPVSPMAWALAVSVSGNMPAMTGRSLPQAAGEVGDRGHAGVVGLDQQDPGPDAEPCGLFRHLGLDRYQGNQRPAAAQRTQRPCRGVAADAVQHDVDVPGRRGEVGRA